jgi:transcriptional regulator with XRE-family HTH domain
VKNKLILEKPFLSGYKLGVAAALFSVKIQELRLMKKVLREEVAKKTGIPLDIIVGLEQANLKTYLSLSTVTLAKISSYYDVTLEIKLTDETADGLSKRKDPDFPQYGDIDITSKDRV